MRRRITNTHSRTASTCGLTASHMRSKLSLPDRSLLRNASKSASTLKSQLDTFNVDASRRRFVQNVQILDVVLARSELLEDGNVFAGTIDGVHRNVELDLPREELREFRKQWGLRALNHSSNGFRGVFGGKNSVTMRHGGQG